MDTFHTVVIIPEDFLLIFTEFYYIIRDATIYTLRRFSDFFATELIWLNQDNYCWTDMAAPRSSFSMSTYLGNLAFPGKMFVTLAYIKNKTKNDNALGKIFLATMVMVLPLRNMDASSSNTVEIIENQILKAINHIKYISKKNLALLKSLITYEIIMLQILITILLKLN